MTKANNGSGNIESRDIWKTPSELFIKLEEQYDFNFDCCAIDKNSKCALFSSDFKNAGDYHDLLNYMCWMNPPFSKALEMFKIFFEDIKKGVSIYRCDNMETKVWQDVILKNASWIFIPKGRIKYEGFEGNSSRFPSALIGFNVDPPKEIEGKILFPSN